jgi:hypothetical protein
MRILRRGAPDGGFCHLQTNLLLMIIDQIHSTGRSISQDHATARHFLCCRGSPMSCPLIYREPSDLDIP